MDLIRCVADAVAAHQWLRRGDRVAVAVSGGPDSVALLETLHRLTPGLRIELLVVHIDHQLRAESADDAEFVRDLAAARGLEATVVRRAVQEEAAQSGRSLEDAARRARYDVLQQVAGERGAAAVALGHTADDQAETVLLRLIRGSGPTGLSAMAASRPLGPVRLIRPLLGVWRRDILEFLREAGLTYRCDASNADVRFLRNRVRHELLPWLESWANPGIRASLVQLAGQCQADTACLRLVAQRYWKRIVKTRPDGLALRLPALSRQPEAIRRCLVRMAIEVIKGDLTGFEFRHWIELERLFTDRPPGTIVDLPGQVQVQRERDWAFMRRHAGPSPETPRGASPKDLPEQPLEQYDERDTCIASSTPV